MEDPIDVYADQFLVTNTAFGSNLSFYLNAAHPEQTKPVPPERIVTIRMSNELLKIMAMMIVRQIKTAETQSGINVSVDKRVLNGLGIAPDDWHEFWKRTDDFKI